MRIEINLIVKYIFNKFYIKLILIKKLSNRSFSIVH